MRFKTFLAVYLTIVISASTIIAIAAPRFQMQNGVVSPNHFSVRWMGFSPTDYNTSYPDYYICINDLKEDPLRMSISLQIKNQEDRWYYFMVDKYTTPPSGWTIDPLYLGNITVDQTKQFVYSNITRTRPSSISGGILTESIVLVVSAYYDNYVTLYSQDSFSVTFNFIDRQSPSFTGLYSNSFDDGAVQGWSAVSKMTYSVYRQPSVVASPDYYRSFQYSLKLVPGMEQWTQDLYNYYRYSITGYRKNFTVSGAFSEAYLLYSIRSGRWVTLGVEFNGTTRFKMDVLATNDKWYQFALPLPTSALTQVTIWTIDLSGTGGGAIEKFAYIDDVVVIAK